jgi:serine O-acetyltransferase
MTDNGIDSLDEMSLEIRNEALRIEKDEPELRTLLRRTVLAPSVETFHDAVASTVCYRLLLTPCNKTASPQSPVPIFCPHSLQALIRECLADSEILEMGHTMGEATIADAQAVCRRDPATDSVLEVVLFSKGYAALVCHRVAYRLWHSKNRRKYTALFLQSQASANFGLDIHPAAQMGSGIMLDHGTGIVIGETATVGDGCTLLHGVTLGGTGKDHGDRHPKISENVLIGAGSSILGNIHVGSGAKIGAGSVVLRDIPAGVTAVGAPAKIIGKAREHAPGSDMDETLQNVSLLHRSMSLMRLSKSSHSTSTTESETETEDDDRLAGDNCCPWRDYARMAKEAPKGTVTICTMRHLLLPERCSPMEFGLCLLELDEKNVGYVKMDVFRRNGVAAIVKHTSLSEERARQIVDKFVNDSNVFAVETSVAVPVSA